MIASSKADGRNSPHLPHPFKPNFQDFNQENEIIDIKSPILWGALGIAAGGGLYGSYIKTMGKAAFTETQAYALYGKCMVQRNKVALPSTHDDTRALIEIINKKMPDIKKSDTIVTITTVAAGEKNASLSGFAALLKDCASNLEREIADATESQ